MSRYAVSCFMFGLFVALVLGIVGKMNQNDFTLSSQNYCNMVRDGGWPDYKHNYQQNCGGKKAPKFVDFKP